jgi:hypothetical protein
MCQKPMPSLCAVNLFFCPAKSQPPSPPVGSEWRELLRQKNRTDKATTLAIARLPKSETPELGISATCQEIRTVGGSMGKMIEPEV